MNLLTPNAQGYTQERHAKHLWKGRALFLQQFPDKIEREIMGKRGWGGSPPKLPCRWERIPDDIVVKLEKQNAYSKRPRWKCRLVFIWKKSICIWLYKEHAYSFIIYYNFNKFF